MKSYTDLEQSKKLAEILPIESADMYYYTVNGDIYKTPNVIESVDDLYVDDKSIPCWSLVALLKMLKDYQLFSNGLIVYINNESYKIDSDNPVDACYEMIIKLHEQKLL